MDTNLIENVVRRTKCYYSDFVDGLADRRAVQKTASTVFFLYFSILLPSIAFGVLNSKNTDGKIGKCPFKLLLYNISYFKRLTIWSNLAGNLSSLWKWPSLSSFVFSLSNTNFYVTVFKKACRLMCFYVDHLEICRFFKKIYF